jgi:hypothetical protein
MSALLIVSRKITFGCPARLGGAGGKICCWGQHRSCNVEALQSNVQPICLPHPLSSGGVPKYRKWVPVFHEVPAPILEELQAALVKVVTRIMRLLPRLGFLIEEQDMTYLADAE